MQRRSNTSLRCARLLYLFYSVFVSNRSPNVTHIEVVTSNHCRTAAMPENDLIYNRDVIHKLPGILGPSNASNDCPMLTRW